MILSKERIEEVQKVLYHHYLNDVVFPRSCGSVSMVLAYLFEKSNLSNDYEISYQRGHYRNDNEEEYFYCDEVSFTFNRGDNLDKFPCLNCNCDYMVGHSWIELKNKKDNKVTILDFTSIQFEEDFIDYHEELLNIKYDKESLYNYLLKRSKFVVHETDFQFNRYINSQRTYTGSHLVKTVKEIIENKGASDLSILLEQLGYIKP